MPYAVIAHYRCAAADAGLIRDALLKMRDHTRREPGNLTYEVHADTDDPAAFILYEQYTDRAGFEAHAASPHFAEYILGTVRPKLTERTVHFGDVLCGARRDQRPPETVYRDVRRGFCSPAGG